MKLRLSKLRERTGREEGTVLLLVMLILTLISVMILGWAQEWRTELKLTGNFAKANKARRLAEAGIFYALGKLVTAKNAERAFHQEVSPDGLWQADQRPHLLDLPDGRVEIRIADEGGKINLNKASAGILRSLLTGLKLTEPQVRTMVDSIQDWRSPDLHPRPFGAKSQYYLGLNPPYVARNGPFETVEELAWVHGFEASPLISRLNRWLTVQAIDKGVNPNTAPLEVLEAIGLPGEVARKIIVTRQQAPFKNFEEIARLVPNAIMSRPARLSFKTSPFFTITATGMGKNAGGRQTIRAIVRVNLKKEEPWTIYSWLEGIPG